MRNKIWAYVNARYEHDGVLVDADEVYLIYQREFDNGTPVELIDEVIQSFASIHELSGIKIEYEGELNGTCVKRVAKSLEVPQQTA